MVVFASKERASSSSYKSNWSSFLRSFYLTTLAYRGTCHSCMGSWSSCSSGFSRTLPLMQTLCSFRVCLGSEGLKKKCGAHTHKKNVTHRNTHTYTHTHTHTHTHTPTPTHPHTHTHTHAHTHTRTHTKTSPCTLSKLHALMKTLDVAEKALYSKTTSRSPRIFARAKNKGSLKNNTISFKASCILLTDALLSNGHKVRELCLKLNVFYSLVQMCLQIIETALCLKYHVFHSLTQSPENYSATGLCLKHYVFYSLMQTYLQVIH